MNGNFARSILCSVVTSVDFGWYSSIVGICCFCVDWSCCVITARGQTMSAANMATKMTEKRVMVRREFILPLGFLNVRLIFPQEAGRAPWNPLLISVARRQAPDLVGLVCGTAALGPCLSDFVNAAETVFCKRLGSR